VPASTESTASGAAMTAGIGHGIFSPTKTLLESSSQSSIYKPRESIFSNADLEEWRKFLKVLMQTYS
jgi:glycerol kinase